LGAKKGGQPTFGGLDIVVQRFASIYLTLIPFAIRNAFGGQLDSFVAPLDIPFATLLPNATQSDSRPFEGVFIRAPIIESVSENVDVVCKTSDGKIVAVKQGNILATAFHPELTLDDRFHRYFASFQQK
jgi:5'-phosphate synthase pdxT subunit